MLQYELSFHLKKTKIKLKVRKYKNESNIHCVSIMNYLEQHTYLTLSPQVVGSAHKNTPSMGDSGGRSCQGRSQIDLGLCKQGMSL